KTRSVAAGRNPLAAGLDSDQAHALVVEKPVKDPNGIAAAADTGHDHVGKAARLLKNLCARLPSDDRLEFPHHERIWMWPERGTEQIVGIRHIRDPVAHRLVDGVFQCLAA